MRVLAVGCHPDDLEIGCYGTLAKYASQGDEVFVCVLTKGDFGHAVIKPEELGPIRVEEARIAAEHIGALKYFNLGASDSWVDITDTQLLLKLADVIREVTPDLIITHGPDDYMKEHIETGRLTLQASFKATVPHVYLNHPHISRVPPVLYMDNLAGVNFLPTQYVDISDTIEFKLEALAKHESQIVWMRDHDGIDFLDFVRTCSKFRGLQCGAGYAEGFRECTTWPRLGTKRLLP